MSSRQLRSPRIWEGTNLPSCHNLARISGGASLALGSFSSSSSRSQEGIDSLFICNEGIARICFPWFLERCIPAASDVSPESARTSAHPRKQSCPGCFHPARMKQFQKQCSGRTQALKSCLCAGKNQIRISSSGNNSPKRRNCR